MSQEQPTYDVQMEADIQRLNLTAPRVTPAQIDALMEQVEYDVHFVPDSTTTVVTSSIKLGDVKFTLAVVTLACIDKRNFSAELGRKYGIEKCKTPTKDKLWELEGYVFAKMLAAEGSTFIDRLVKEHADNAERLDKLRKFLKTEPYMPVSENERDLLFRQHDAMGAYDAVLRARLSIHGVEV